MSSFEDRRRARAGWAIRRCALGDEPRTDERIPDDVDARVAMVAALTRAQWALSGQDLPRYRREDMPGHVRRPWNPARDRRPRRPRASDPRQRGARLPRTDSRAGKR